MIPNTRLRVDDCPEKGEEDEERGAAYRSLVGGLRYLADMTQPDIAFTVGELRCFSQNPGEVNWIAAKRVLRYLKGTKHWKIRFDGNQDLTLVGFTDSDWGGDLNTRDLLLATFSNSVVALSVQNRKSKRW